MPLELRTDPRWELVSLGEIMLRLDPGVHRVADATTLEVCEGGGEYNVAKALARTFGRRTAHVTALPTGQLGDAVVQRLRAGGVDDTLVTRVPADPIGRRGRVGLNFTERGLGTRTPLGLVDRAHSAAAAMKPGDVDWGAILTAAGWLHTGGIFASLSDGTFALTIEGMRAARAAGVPVSFDPNFRPSLWEGRGDVAAAHAAFAELMALSDVLFGVPGFEDPDAFDGDALRAAVPEGPALVSAPLRRVVTASRHRLGGYLLRGGELTVAPPRDVEVLDRVGSGDGFAAGVLEGLFAGDPDATTVARGVALAALVASTPGDTSCASAEEVARAMAGQADVDR